MFGLQGSCFYIRNIIKVMKTDVGVVPKEFCYAIHGTSSFRRGRPTRKLMVCYPQQQLERFRETLMMYNQTKNME
jgi:hypothetical protein